MVLVEETSQKLLELYEYERQRVAAGAMSEATYRSNARMVLEGDDAFRVEQLYSMGTFDVSEDGKEGQKGMLVMSFLPEREEEDDDDVEVEDDDDEEEMDDTAKAETVAYMQAFMQCTRTPSLPARTGNRGGLMRKAGKRAPDWDVALLRPGLECRSAVGSCKLRFVCRSEDLWLANVKRKAAKRNAKSTTGGSSTKRQKMTAFLESKQGKEGPNTLGGQPAAKRAPLPREHTLKPLEGAAAS